MKRSLPFSLLFLLSTIVILNACNKEEKQRERLDGKWIYEKAIWQEKAFSRTNILDDYLYIDAYFTLAGDVKFIDIRDSLVFLGTYTLDDDTETVFVDEEGNAIPITKTQMLLSYSDTASKKQYQELWDMSRIGKNKIKYETEIDGKKAYFTLRRQLF